MVVSPSVSDNRAAALGTGALVLIVCLAAASCTAALGSSVARGVDVRAFKVLRVIRNPSDTRNTWSLIAQGIARTGRQVSVASDETPASDVDAIVTYHEAWVWSKEWYLKDLILQFRDPRTSVLLATVQLERPADIRKPVSHMVDEALAAAFASR